MEPVSSTLQPTPPVPENKSILFEERERKGKLTSLDCMQIKFDCSPIKNPVDPPVCSARSLVRSPVRLLVFSSAKLKVQVKKLIKNACSLYFGFEQAMRLISIFHFDHEFNETFPIQTIEWAQLSTLTRDFLLFAAKKKDRQSIFFWQIRLGRGRGTEMVASPLTESTPKSTTSCSN